jgi:hypothetical protein
MIEDQDVDASIIEWGLDPLTDYEPLQDFDISALDSFLPLLAEIFEPWTTPTAEATRTLAAEAMVSLQDLCPPEPPPPEIIPTDADVLFGRGAGVNAHAGNRRFLTLVRANAAHYQATERTQKRRLAQSLVRSVQRSGGRFLQRNCAGQWVEATEQNAVKKTQASLCQVTRIRRVEPIVVVSSPPKPRRRSARSLWTHQMNRLAEKEPRVAAAA